VSSDSEPQLSVRWVGNEKLPLVSAVEPENLVEGTKLVGLPIDQALAVLGHQGWSMNTFRMTNYWMNPDRSTRVYTLHRPGERNTWSQIVH
jgi:hypothetical protein